MLKELAIGIMSLAMNVMLRWYNVNIERGCVSASRRSIVRYVLLAM